MRILTVRQPWAWAIIHGGKTVENRIRNLAGSYRGPVAIHAAKEWDDAVTWNQSWGKVLAAMKADGAEPFDAPWQSNRGVIIGVVDLVDAHAALDCMTQDRDGDWKVCTEWSERSGYHLVFANPRALDQPVPWKGGLGLRRTDLFVSGDWLGEHIDPGHSACTPYGCPPSCGSEPVARLVATT